MVTIYNKSNRPIGVAGQSVLPDREIKIQDKFAYCDAYDEDGVATGERVLLPGLVALKNMKFVDIHEEKEVAAHKEEPKADPVPENEPDDANEDDVAGGEPVEGKKATKRGRKSKNE